MSFESSVGIIKYDPKHVGSSILLATVEEYSLHDQSFSKIHNVEQDIVLEHQDNEYSYLTNTFNTEMVTNMVNKKDDADGGFNVQSLKYLVIPAAVGFVILY